MANAQFEANRLKNMEFQNAYRKEAAEAISQDPMAAYQYGTRRDNFIPKSYKSGYKMAQVIYSQMEQQQ